MADETPSLSIPLTQKLKNISGIFGIRLGEAPSYEVIKSEGDKEIRKYHSYILASMTVNGSFEEARKEAISSLLHYIFGENKERKPLKVTLPILQSFHNNSWNVSFILPFEYNLASAPTPKDKRIHLHKNPESLVATIRYSGVNSPDKIKSYSTQLMEWINKLHFYNPVGDIQSAEYDGPMTIGFLRRNEIQIIVSGFQ